TMAFTPRQKLDNQLVYSENGSSIELVIVAGQIVVADGRVTTIDEDAVRAELNGRLAEIIQWQDGLDAANGALTDAFSQMYARAMQTPGPLNRFSGNEPMVLV
ncbi:MAG: 5-methylthioadenosine/S-adenosylhomocysteine deaminase, partial [Microbacteriaceae bacterium]|nr:5-methylthioadenosine/S-adenosylhomocysteine deaminase [Microbacteriaceae bacterium]